MGGYNDTIKGKKKKKGFCVDDRGNNMGSRDEGVCVGKNLGKKRKGAH